jgi:hypothetical protein
LSPRRETEEKEKEREYYSERYLLIPPFIFIREFRDAL